MAQFTNAYLDEVRKKYRERRLEAINEPRMPDPILTFYAWDNTYSEVLTSWDTSVRGGMIAHLAARTLTSDTSSTKCGFFSVNGYTKRQARHVRWHAEACNTCFAKQIEDMEREGINLSSDNPFLRWQKIR